VIRTATLNRAVPAVALVLAICAPPPAGSEMGSDAPKSTTLEAAGRTLQWSPRASYERISLTVSGPGGIVRRDFSAGEKPAIELPADRADGSYAWE